MKDTKHRPAKICSASFNADDNTVDIIWSTGSDVLRQDWDGPFIERLSMEPGAVDLSRLNAGAPMLDTHAADCLGSVIGVVVSGSARIEDGKGLATIKLSSAASDADSVRKIRDGIVRNISVWYWVDHSERQEGNPPIVFVDKWTPLEVSAVPIPADPGSQIRAATHRKAKPLTKEHRDYQVGAARASRLLGNASVPVSKEYARGAAATRSLKSGKGKLRVETAKSTALDPAEFARGARVARKLLRVAK
jgi:phage head maturation protease